MKIIPITHELCHQYREKLNEYIYRSVRNSRYVDSFSQKDAEQKCAELEEYLKIDRAVCYGAFDEEELVGFIWAYEYPFRDDKKRLYISIIYIDEAYRGCHIGSKLLEKVNEYAEEYGYSALFLHTEGNNLNAQAFYKAAGFEPERLQLVRRLDAAHQGNGEE